MENHKIKSFTDLITWQEGHKIVLLIYGITDNFPQKEIYALTNQMRRAAVSITSNIAEGFSRYSKKEKIQFYYTALGSLTELQSQLIVTRDVNYINEQKFNEILGLSINVSKLINGLIKSLRV